MDLTKKEQADADVKYDALVASGFDFASSHGTMLRWCFALRGFEYVDETIGQHWNLR